MAALTPCGQGFLNDAGSNSVKASVTGVWPYLFSPSHHRLLPS